MSDDLVVWDYGGQQLYRERYLKAAEKYLNDLDFVYYVVDVQNGNHESNLEYFNQLYEKITEFNQSVVFVLVFNKLDPEMKDRIKVYEQTVDLVADYKKTIDLTKNKLYYYFTSIYDPLTIITVFSEVLVEAEFRKKIREILLEELKGEPIVLSLVLSAGWFRIGGIESDELEFPVIQDFLRELSKNLQTVPKEELTNDVIINDLQINMGRFSVHNQDFYIAIAYGINKKDVHDRITEKIPQTIQKIKDVIERFGDIL
jgi:hypothetical protein